MANIISDTGFWLEYNDDQHVFIPELSKEINQYVNSNEIETVYDFGCGKGDYLEQLVNEYPSVVATGFEGYVNNTTYKNVSELDLSKPADLEPVDLVISIEVGEHIPNEFESVFLDNISNSSKKHVILSWAIEGQDGNGHINCKNNDYIISQMQKRGWKFNDKLTSEVRAKMPPLWIKNTIMFFNK